VPAGRSSSASSSSIGCSGRKCREGREAGVIHGKKVVVVLPAYNAERTLERTIHEIPKDVVDEILVVDDASHDRTVSLARALGLQTFVHRENLGYGGNQKTCYTEALSRGADLVIMLHPDYQYDPRLVPAMASLIASDLYDVILGSRIIGNGALRGGMPRYKYFFNRVLTALQNLLLGEKLSEYHSGYRGFTRRVLETLPLEANSNDFVFDNQMLSQIFYFGFRVGEVSCPTRYLPESSSIDFRSSVKYGLGVLWTSVRFRLARMGWAAPRIFDPKGPKLGMQNITARIVREDRSARSSSP
jgi:glycosyltransferase involved in cell wall biosynthesis